MINKDLLTGMRLEMKSLGLYVPAPETSAAPASTATTITAPVTELPSAEATVAETPGSTGVPTSTLEASAATETVDEAVNDATEEVEAPAATE